MTNIQNPKGTKVLAFGTGVFLRAFLCDFADHAGVPVTLISSTPEGDKRVASLMQRNGAFTIAFRGFENGQIIDNWHTVRSVSAAYSAANEWEKARETAHDPQIEVVASNVTESALRLSDNPAQDTEAGAASASFPAKLTTWLYERWHYFKGDASAGVIILPCELVEKNGTILRGLVGSLLEQWNLGAEFTEWLNRNCLFADTLVDRIVPGTPPESERGFWQERLGDNDPLLTIAEPFALWAIQGDASLAARLDWLVQAGAGSIVVAEDITPYVLRKVRFLNGLHTVMASIAPAYPGVETVRQAIEHPELGVFLRELLYDEILPANCPPLDLAAGQQYADQTYQRMSNPFVAHRLSDIARGAAVKWQNRLLPTISAYQEQFGVPPRRISACYQQYLQDQMTRNLTL